MDAVLAAAGMPAVPRHLRTRIFANETRSEFLRLLRAPSFCIPTLAFPLMFYVLFGVLLGGGASHAEQARRALVAFVVVGAMAPGLFALGNTLAVDRERGLLQLKRALPLPAGIYLAAKMVMAMLFAAIAALAIMLTAAAAGGVTLKVAQWLQLLALAAFGVLPFCAMGLFVGSCARAAATPALLNLIYLPMSFLSGLWVPLAYLPHGIGALAPAWPAWHLAQIGMSAVGLSSAAANGTHLLALLAVTAAFFLAARRRLARPR